MRESYRFYHLVQFRELRCNLRQTKRQTDHDSVDRSERQKSMLHAHIFTCTCYLVFTSIDLRDLSIFFVCLRMRYKNGNNALTSVILRIIIGHYNGTSQISELHHFSSAVEQAMSANSRFLSNGAFLFICQVARVDHNITELLQ